MTEQERDVDELLAAFESACVFAARDDLYGREIRKAEAEREAMRARLSARLLAVAVIRDATTNG